MNSLLHIGVFVGLLWLTSYCYADLSNSFLAFVSLVVACWVFVLMILAILHDTQAMFSRQKDEE